MDKVPKTESHLSCAAAFVEGGIQEACDDACSICLEDFCDSDPSTVTSCKHEYHLQCILEWCQRSSQCPMCWQPISLKDPASQELLEAVERERTLRQRQPRNSTIFHHPTLGDFELQHLPIDANEAELEERIMQHLAAAAAMGRAHRHHGRSRGHGRPQYLVFSANPNASPASASSGQAGENDLASAADVGSPSIHVLHGGEESSPSITSTNSIQPIQISHTSSERNSSSQSTPVNQEAGPSDLQSISESLKSRFNAVSTRYKDCIIKSTRGWKERLFSRNQSVADIGSEVRREVNAGIATVSRIMERLDTRDNNSGAASSAAQNPEGNSVTTPRATESHTEDIQSVENPPASSAAASGST